MQELGEDSYEMPSKIIREILGITEGDGYNYYDYTGKRVAYNTNAGERYGESQYMLLIDGKAFIDKVKEKGFQPVWFVRVLKEPSAKAREKYNFYTSRDETFMVWKRNKQWIYKKIYDASER